MASDKIIIRGARVHNLKNINLELPKNKFIVITGVSGSGKSSLAFDTIYAEGQRRYVESLSSYARQFLGLMEKPDVDQISGLSPAICIDQKSVSKNPRSTVGTITEIYDYLRLLFARVGQPHCPRCGKQVSSQRPNEILNKILGLPKKEKISLLAPIVRDKKGEHKQIFKEIKKAGYSLIRLDGRIYQIDEAEAINLDKNKKHSIEVVVDSLILGANSKDRLADSLETALDLGDGLVVVSFQGKKKDLLFSQYFVCPQCGINLPELAPRNFSFNSPHGACPECSGLGTKLTVDPDLVIPNKKLTLGQGAIRPWSSTASGRKAWYNQVLQSLADKYGIPLDTPVEKIPKKYLDIILYGEKKKASQIENSQKEVDEIDKEDLAEFEGVVVDLEKRYKETDSDYVRSEIERYMREEICPKCQGKRLRPESLAVRIAGLNINDIVRMPIEKSYQKLSNLIPPTAKNYKIAKQILKEITTRLGFLKDVGLEYLTLDRSSVTLAGGEAQRIRLATQIGLGLSGVIYILDEPSVGLHQRDNVRLIKTLKNLRDLGNTVIVVEHDENIILSADEIVDIGPGAGQKGGEVVCQGQPDTIKKDKKSLTGLYLAGKKKVPTPKKYRRGNGKSLKILGASEFNLKDINVEIPLGKFVCVTGVSGSGKSTLVDEILGKALAQKFHHAKARPGQHKKILGIEHIDKVVRIDQSPIGRAPRSNPATYTGVFTYIRDLFANTPEARIKGFKAGHFSFNVKGGRCENCQGDGFIKIGMQFLPDVYVECEECHGKRYNKRSLEIYYKGKNIAEVLEMTVDQALHFFRNTSILQDKLQILTDVGLGYIQLGQPATTLSGGEAQRVKLATELSRRATGKTLYILDEPTTGLHFDDIKKLLKVLNRLVDKGNTVLVVEHNLDIIKSSDWIIDLGPEGGDKGGKVVACGTPREIAKVKKSYTGQFLKKLLK